MNRMEYMVICHTFETKCKWYHSVKVVFLQFTPRGYCDPESHARSCISRAIENCLEGPSEGRFTHRALTVSP